MLFRSGYFALATALRDWVQREVPPDAATLSGLTTTDVCSILGQSPANASLQPFIALCVQALHDLARFLTAELSGHYSAILDRGDYRADAIVTLLQKMPMFRDISTLAGQDIFILKRAQIFVHDLAIALDQLGARRIEGLDRIAIFADNIIPFILERHGVLRYHPALKQRIEEQRPLRQGSRAEIELRACSIHACELIRQRLTTAGIPATARTVDFLLWNDGTLAEAGPANSEADSKTHICLTHFY